MGILEKLRRGISEDKKEFKEKFKNAEQEMRVQKMLEERQKSANQRELERYEKEKFEKEIKNRLDQIHKQQTQQMWKSNMFKQKTNMLKNDRPILRDDRKILVQKNIFLDNRLDIPFERKGGMFFK